MKNKDLKERYREFAEECILDTLRYGDDEDYYYLSEIDESAEKELLNFISKEIEKAREEVLKELLKKAVLPAEAKFMKHRIMEYNNDKSKLKSK